MSDDALVFLHMSDIHFRFGAGFDLDADIRNELERDVERIVPDTAGVAGLLITGDVAFRGAAEEYESARQWLKRICAAAGCPAEQVWVVPGNHDIDRTVVTGSQVLQGLQRDLRRSAVGTVDDLLDRYAHDTLGSDLLFRAPLANYTKFAAQFECAPISPAFYWSFELPLNDGSTLALRGVNSVLVSNASDDMHTDRMIVGEYQLTPPMKDGVVNLLMCHHPPGWFLDEDNLDDVIRQRYRIQLFGHKHRQRMMRIDDSVRLYAGAVHPSRQETAWEPRYNALSIRVSESRRSRLLEVQVWPRVWSSSERQFVADRADTSDPFTKYDLPLEPWSKRTVFARSGEVSRSVPEIQRAAAADPPEVQPVKMNRRLVYRFYGLPFHTRMEIALQLGLIRDEDQQLSDIARFDRVLTRATELGRVAELARAIDEKESSVS